MFNRVKYNTHSYNTTSYLFQIVGVIREQINPRTKKRVYRFARYFSIDGSLKNRATYNLNIVCLSRRILDNIFYINGSLRNLYFSDWQLNGFSKHLILFDNTRLIGKLRNKFKSRFFSKGTVCSSYSFSCAVSSMLSYQCVYEFFSSGSKMFQYKNSNDILGSRQIKFLDSQIISGNRNIVKILQAAGVL